MKFKVTRNSKGAMEMSVGTIVTIVLLMSVLVLGIFMVQRIFSGSTNAIDQIDAQVQGQINKLFAEEGKTFVVYPQNGEISIKKGDAKGMGFGFSIKNEYTESQDFTYTVAVENNFDFAKCGSTLNAAKANSFLVVNSGTVPLGPGRTMSRAEIIKFVVPKASPDCTVPFRMIIKDGSGEIYEQTRIYVTIK